MVSKAYSAFARAFQRGAKLGVGVLDWTPPEVIGGAGSVKKLASKLRADGVTPVLVVTDKGLMKLGLLD